MFSSHHDNTVRCRRSTFGFTLIELLVVIDIISILAAILFPVFARVRENARKATCQSNLKQIGIAVMMYVQDYDERYPMRYLYAATASSTGEAGWYFNVIQPYVKSERGKGVWVCPTAGAIGAHSTSYGWNICGAQTSTAVIGRGFGYTPGTPCTPTGTVGVASAEVTETASTILLGDPASNGTDDNGQNLYPSWWQSQIPVLHGGQVGPFTGGRVTMTRYEGGGNYLFADGHVKFLQNTYVWPNRQKLFSVDK